MIRSKEAMRTLKTGKSLGIDNTPTKLLKYAGDVNKNVIIASCKNI